MLTLLLFLAVLSVLVLIHELGHYVAARIFGVKAEEFGFGFPPRAIGFVKVNGKWKRVNAADRASYAGTIWSLNWLPLGGFVRLKGEEGDHEHDRDSYLSKPIWQRALILVAGVLMNWLLAAIIFSTAFTVGVPVQTDQLPKGAIVHDEKVQIMEVLPKSAAESVGIQVGDYLSSVNGVAVAHIAEVQLLIASHASDTAPMRIELARNHHTETVSVKAAYLAALKRPGLGVSLADTGNVRFPWPQAITQGFATTWQYTELIILGIVGMVRDLIVTHRVTADVAGPVGIAVMTGRIAHQSAWAVVQFAAMLSLNLAVINFLPIPALDGGRALFIAIESLRRRKINPKREALIHQIGLIVLLVLVAIVTVHDLRQYGGIIWRGLKRVVGL